MTIESVSIIIFDAAARCGTIHAYGMRLTYVGKVLCLLQTVECEGASFSRLWVALEHRL